MRMIALLATAVALLGCTVSADQYVKTSQADARAVEDRWQNCSQVVNGRLGALHPAGDVTELFQIQQYDPVTGYNVTYRPCYKGEGEFAAYVTMSADFATTMQYPTASNNQQVVRYLTPEKKGDIPRFVGDYTRRMNNGDLSTVHVTTFCAASLHNATVKKVNNTNDWEVHLFSIDACPRFPYTNKSVPPGGIAAIVILLISFGLQFGICGWYHKTVKLDSNPADRKYDDVQ